MQKWNIYWPQSREIMHFVVCIHLSVWVCESYIVHHFNGTGLCLLALSWVNRLSSCDIQAIVLHEFYQTWSWEIICLVASICPSEFAETTLCTTLLVHSYVVHHWSALPGYLSVIALTLEHYQSVCLSVISITRVSSRCHESTFVQYLDGYVVTSLWHQSGKKNCKHRAAGGASTLWHFNLVCSFVWSNWDDFCITRLNPPI